MGRGLKSERNLRKSAKSAVLFYYSGTGHRRDGESFREKLA
jgi:hypothetical protein